MYLVQVLKTGSLKASVIIFVADPKDSSSHNASEADILGSPLDKEIRHKKRKCFYFDPRSMKRVANWHDLCSSFQANSDPILSRT